MEQNKVYVWSQKLSGIKLSGYHESLNSQLQGLSHLKWKDKETPTPAPRPG